MFPIYVYAQFIRMRDRDGFLPEIRNQLIVCSLTIIA